MITPVIATRHYGVSATYVIETKADKAQPQIWCNYNNRNEVAKVGLAILDALFNAWKLTSS